jgi:hypothetical protein
MLAIKLSNPLVKGRETLVYGNYWPFGIQVVGHHCPNLLMGCALAICTSNPAVRNLRKDSTLETIFLDG